MGLCSSKNGAAGASAAGPTGHYGTSNGNGKGGGGGDSSPASSKGGGGGGGDLRYNMLKASKGDRFNETYEVYTDLVFREVSVRQKQRRSKGVFAHGRPRFFLQHRQLLAAAGVNCCAIHKQTVYTYGRIEYLYSCGIDYACLVSCCPSAVYERSCSHSTLPRELCFVSFAR